MLTVGASVSEMTTGITPIPFHKLATNAFWLASGSGEPIPRVPVELLFDTGLGDLSVTRHAGTVAMVGMTGCLEYAVAAANCRAERSPLIPETMRNILAY